VGMELKENGEHDNFLPGEVSGRERPSGLLGTQLASEMLAMFVLRLVVEIVERALRHHPAYWAI
jgi:hypothetical protein